MSDTDPQQNKQQQADPEDPLHDINEPFGDGKKALIVEDDPITSELIRKLLVQRLFEVQEAKNGKNALEKIQQNFKPDVIISDLMMPEMDGFQFFKGLKADAATEKIPVIFLTARKNMEDSMLAVGAEAFFPKPLDADAFLLIVKKVLLRSHSSKSSSDEPAEKTSSDSPDKTEEANT